MRELLAAPQPEAKEAVDLFCYRIQREIGSLAAALGGLDALVFTGGIGEHDEALRQEVVCALSWLSPFDVMVIAADEEQVIARACRGKMNAEPGSRGR
jgi:acetate kinase